MYLLTEETKMKVLPIVLAILLLCGGCSLFQQKDPTPALPEMNTGEDVGEAKSIIANSTKEIKGATSEITTATQTIKDETSETKGKIPAEVKKQIEPHLHKIDVSSATIEKNTQEINKAVAELAGAESLLANAKGKIKSIEDSLETMTKERDEAIKDRDEAIADSKSQLKKTLRWITVGCIILAGVFAVLFVLHGSKFGLTGAAICAVVCAISIFVQTYFIYVAIAGGLILLGLIGALVYQVIVKNKAFKEVVETVEVVQDNMPESTKTKLFGGAGETGIMDTIQSPSTMELVRKEKSKMDKLWSYAKRKAGAEPGKNGVA